MARKKTDEIGEEVKEPAPKQAGFVVYADFDGYRAGDAFPLPTGWIRDVQYEELLLNKQKRREGVVFIKADGLRVVLPVREA